MVHVRVLEAYIYFALIYMADHIFQVLLIKDLINEDGEPTTPFKLATGTKPSISHLPALFFSFVVKKSTANVGKKTLNMHHPSEKGFSQYLRCYNKESKMVYCLCTTQTEDRFFV